MVERIIHYLFRNYKPKQNEEYDFKHYKLIIKKKPLKKRNIPKPGRFKW